MARATTKTSYAIAIGSNRRGRHGAPVREVAAAVRALRHVVAVAPVVTSAPVGPSSRQYANGAVLVRSRRDPPAMLAKLKRIEARFGRRPGQRWGARVIDLDIILWSGGIWASAGLSIPHPAFRARAFVLRPLKGIVPDWRDPIGGRRVRHLAALVDRRAPRP